MIEPVAVVIADDHPLFRAGLCEVLLSDPALVLAGEFSDGEAALAFLRAGSPVIAILDIDMPTMSGLAVARELQRAGSEADVILLTMYRDEDIFNEAMDAGVRAYVLKDAAAEEILKAVHAVAEGRRFISAALSSHLVGRSGRAEAFLRPSPSIEDLTPAEVRVLRLVAEQKTSRAIADELGISPKTVENHRTAIAAKLHLRGSHSLLKFALENREKLAGP